tara:strand:- start:1036 stop:1677 length:642 start_codon:yes stop_codon:yes gene_type:complete
MKIEFKKEYLKKRIIVDVGSSAYPLQAYGTPDEDAEIFLFEPRPDFYQELVDKYGNEENYHLSTLALSNNIGTSTFYSTQKRNCSSLFEPNKEEENINRRWEEAFNYETFDVETNTLDNIFQDFERVDYMKLDTQGNEYDILSAGKELLTKTMFVKVEVHLTEYYKGQKFMEDYIELFKSLDFEEMLWKRQISPDGLFQDAFFANNRDMEFVV